MKTKIHYLVIILALALPLISRAQSIEEIRTSVLADASVTKEIKEAIVKRLVIVGMCPKEAFAAAGFPGPYMVQADKKIWKSDIPPPVIINAQCKSPDDSIIELMFRNSTQYGGKDSAVFRVRFEKGRAVLIDQDSFSKG